MFRTLVTLPEAVNPAGASVQSSAPATPGEQSRFTSVALVGLALMMLTVGALVVRVAKHRRGSTRAGTLIARRRAARTTTGRTIDAHRRASVACHRVRAQSPHARLIPLVAHETGQATMPPVLNPNTPHNLQRITSRSAASNIRQRLSPKRDKHRGPNTTSNVAL